MFFESSLWELAKFIANGIPKLSAERSKRSLVFIQSRWVNIKIVSRREPGLLTMLLISLMKKLLMLVGAVKHGTSNIIEEINKGTACTLGSNREVHKPKDMFLYPENFL